MNSLLIVLDSKKSLALSFLGILICLTGFFPLEKRLGTQILDVLHRCIQENFGDLREDRLI